MIRSKKIKGYYVLTKGKDDKYERILNDVLSYNISVEKIFRNIDDTKVVLITTRYGKFILKFFAPKQKRLERFLKSVVKGDYYENLFLQTDRIRKEGVDSVNDFYLLAEKKIFRYSSVYIMLIEYIEGVELSELDIINGDIKLKINQLINELHSHGMVSGDAHKGNFIITNDVLRIIDLSGKSCTRQRKAKDRIDLERHYGIINQEKDIGYYILIYKKKVREFIKALKGKKK